MRLNSADFDFVSRNNHWLSNQPLPGQHKPTRPCWRIFLFHSFSPSVDCSYITHSKNRDHSTVPSNISQIICKLPSTDVMLNILTMSNTMMLSNSAMHSHVVKMPEYSLMPTPVHHRTTGRQTRPTISLWSMLSLTCMFMCCGRKPEYQEKSHACMHAFGQHANSTH